MLSSTDLERLIAAKKREIESEKTVLGLLPPKDTCVAQTITEDKENECPLNTKNQPRQRQVSFNEASLSSRDDSQRKTEIKNEDKCEADVPVDLERYIRRYLGLPVMLKAGEYSPNNPLYRAAPVGRDALHGLGEYELRRDTLRRLRQKEYRDCLEQQARKKRELKEQEDRERREREERERAREQQLLERDNVLQQRIAEEKARKEKCSVKERDGTGKVDCGTQVEEEWKMPLSIGVQTDESTLFRVSPQLSPSLPKLTQAERELSPRTVSELREDRPVIQSFCALEDKETRSSRDRSVSHYTPSIFDADLIRQRNAKAEQEAAAKRHSYQQELRNQIMEQQRIREERKAREKMLEQAEMRRLEQQLKMLKTAQENEIDKNQLITIAMNTNAKEFDRKRSALQKDIEKERVNLTQASKRTIYTSRSDTTKTPLDSPKKDKPFSVNIPENSIFSSSYDVDSYLRRNLNPKRDVISSNYNSAKSKEDRYSEVEDRYSFGDTYLPSRNLVLEKPVVNSESTNKTYERPRYEPSFLRKDINDLIQKDTVDESLPIPVLRHSPKVRLVNERPIENGSDAMKKIEEKWTVPAVQKNILKSLPSGDGKKVNILTQLGSIRRQLQLEQLRLDKLAKNE